MRSAASLVLDARGDAGLSFREVGRRAGMPASTVARVERGESDPSVTTLLRLLGACGHQLQGDLRRISASSIAAQVDAWPDGAQSDEVDWTRLRAFVDRAIRRPDLLEEAIATPPARTGRPIDALLAGVATKLAHDASLAPPPWTDDVPALEEPWVPMGTPRMQARHRAAAPPELARLNVFLDVRELWRARG